MPRVGQPGRGHQRQLVRRQAPDRARRHREDDPPYLPGLDIGEQLLDLRCVRGPAERERAFDGWLRHGAAGDEKRGVRDGAAWGGVREATSRIDGDELSGREGRAGVGRQLRQLEVPHLAEPERLGHRERPVPEVRLGREKLDPYAIFCERPQSERGFERRDASACDEDARPIGGIRWHEASVAPTRGETSGTRLNRDVANYRPVRCWAPIYGSRATVS